MIKRLLYRLTILSILAISCDSNKKTATEEKTAENIKVVNVPGFNAAFVAKQVDFGPRVSGSQAHKEQFETKGASVTVQEFEIAETQKAK